MSLILEDCVLQETVPPTSEAPDKVWELRLSAEHQKSRLKAPPHYHTVFTFHRRVLANKQATSRKMWLMHTPDNSDSWFQDWSREVLWNVTVQALAREEESHPRLTNDRSR